MRGRPPKAIEQKQREGNAGKRALPEPVKLGDGMPQKPANLPPVASELWDEVVPLLHQAGVVHQIDRAALTIMCLELARFDDMIGVVEEESPFGLGSMGQVVAHPALGEARASAGMFLRYAEHFAMTPSARARIAVLASVKSGVDLEAILDAGPTRLAMEAPGMPDDDE